METVTKEETGETNSGRNQTESMASIVTPSRRRQTMRSASSSPKVQMVLRSGRKTMVPPEYSKDLGNRVLSRSARKKVVLQDDVNDVSNAGCSTPLKSSKSGRLSARRKSRKSKSHFDTQNVNLDADIMEAIVNVVDENKENVEPEKFSKIEKIRLEQRKSFESAILRQQNRRVDVERLNCSDSVIPRLKAKGSPYVKTVAGIFSVLRSRECDKISTENDNASEQMTTEENSNDVESIKKVSTRATDDDNISDFGLRHLDDSSDSILLCEQNDSPIVVDELTPAKGLNSSECVCISDEENTPKVHDHETSDSVETECINCEEEEAEKSRNVSLNSTVENVKPGQMVTPVDVTTDSQQAAISSSGVGVNEAHISQCKSFVSKMDAKQLGLHRIRRRSSSAPSERRVHHVTFHSPANETVIFNMDSSVDSKKDDTSFTIEQSHGQSISEGIKGPRKRSLSLGEVNERHPLKTDLVEVPSKFGTPKRVLLRKKVPNFNEIHQRRFEKMENLGEHLERKAERAKHLTNSGTKLRQAHTFLMSNEKKKKTNEEEEGAKKKKIEGKSKFKPKNILKTTAGRAGASVWNTAHPSTSTNCKPSVAIVKPMPINISKAKEVKQVGSDGGGSSFVTSGASRGPDKVHERRERHMKMFKKGAGDRSERQTTEFVRGIRSNRRFELQMQYRQNRLKQDHQM